MTRLTAPEIAAARTTFGRDGVLILRGFFAESEIAAAQAATDRVKRDRPLDVVIDNLHNGERTVLGLMSPARIAHDRMKINDLYLTVPEIRELALSPKLVPLLAALLGHPPALCNSLYLERSSTQELHVDALYMTPRTPGHLIAAWIALEDALPGAGQLEYVPGSHRIPLHVFSDGSHHFIQAEMAAWRQAIAAQVAAAGLPSRFFDARKGDILFWHANLLHGGGTITNPGLTRKSIVLHYFSLADASTGAAPLVPQGGACWIDRAPQDLPPEIARQLPFSEKNYLARYPDVAGAVRAGRFPTGAAHYQQHGEREGRLPC